MEFRLPFVNPAGSMVPHGCHAALITVVRQIVAPGDSPSAPGPPRAPARACSRSGRSRLACPKPGTGTPCLPDRLFSPTRHNESKCCIRIGKHATNLDRILVEAGFHDEIRGWAKSRLFLADDIQSHGKTYRTEPASRVVWLIIALQASLHVEHPRCPSQDRTWLIIIDRSWPEYRAVRKLRHDIDC
jgi:hypothetical protein